VERKGVSDGGLHLLMNSLDVTPQPGFRRHNVIRPYVDLARELHHGSLTHRKPKCASIHGKVWYASEC